MIARIKQGADGKKTLGFYGAFFLLSSLS